MKTAIILGAGQMGLAAAELLNPNKIKLVGFGDNDSQKWNIYDENGELKKSIDGLPIMPVELAATLDPDLIIIGVLDEDRSYQLSEQAIRSGFCRDLLPLKELYARFDIRSGCIRRIARRLNEKAVPGAIAELGVYKGDTAWQLNVFMPGRRMYLFDTFDGFDARDVDIEARSGYSGAKAGDFSDTTAENVVERLPLKEGVIIKKGYFPETAADMKEERFAFVSLDADLYAPTLAGLEYFYPRLHPGGMILLHDYNNSRFSGVWQAVNEYEKDHGQLPMVPISDLHSSSVILHP